MPWINVTRIRSPTRLKISEGYTAFEEVSLALEENQLNLDIFKISITKSYALLKKIKDKAIALKVFT